MGYDRDLDQSQKSGKTSSERAIDHARGVLRKNSGHDANLAGGSRIPMISSSDVFGSLEREKGQLAKIDEGEPAAEQSMRHHNNSSHEEKPKSGGLASLFEATAAEQDRNKRRI